MKSGRIHAGFLKAYWTQLGKNANIKDLKVRMMDHLLAAGHQIEMDDLRLWLHQNNEN